MAAIHTALQEEVGCVPQPHGCGAFVSGGSEAAGLQWSSIALAAHALCRANAKSSAGSNSYYYSFDAEIPGWDHPGTFHSVDCGSSLKPWPCWRPFTGKHYDLARQMCNYWANFIATGNPNGNDVTGQPMTYWMPFTPISFLPAFCRSSYFC